MIYHLARNACIRFFKEVLALKSVGVKVQPVGKRFGYSDMIGMMGPVWHWSYENDLAEILFGFEAGDLVHVHAEPGAEAGLAHMVRRICGEKVVVVLDVHDSEWGRGRKIHKNEVLDLNAADVLIVPSQLYADRSQWRGPLATVPSAAIFGPFNSTEDEIPHLGGLVYEGGIGLNDWRDYRDLFSELSDHGARVFCYAPNAHEMMLPYHQTGAVMQMRPYRSLLVDLTRHDWALVCPPADGNEEWESAMPNKFYEALASGLPILTYGCEEVGKIIADSGGMLGKAFGCRSALVAWAGEGHLPTKEMRQACCDWSAANGMMAKMVPTILAIYKAAALAKGGK